MHDGRANYVGADGHAVSLTRYDILNRSVDGKASLYFVPPPSSDLQW